MTASEHSDSQSPSAQPLLQNFDFDITQKKRQSSVSLRSLEDGDNSDSGSEFEDLRRRGKLGFWKRLRMSMRRRRNSEGRDDDFKAVRLGGDEKTRTQRWRCRRRTCLGAPVVIMAVL